MNGFISKYRWIIVIVTGGLAAGLIYYSQQDETPVVTIAEISENLAGEVVEDEPKATTSGAADKVTPAQDQPAAELVEEEEHPKGEEVLVDGQEPEAPPSEPDPVEVVEEDLVEDAPVVEEIASEDEPATIAVVADPTPETPIETAQTAEPEAVEEAAEAMTEEQPVETDSQTTEAAAVIEALASTITVTNDDETTEAMKPSFDIVRVDSTGSAVIAGTAEPFSKVVILSNGKDIGEAIAGSTGEFVAIIQVPENEEGQTLELESEIDGKLVFSDETILILPILRSNAAEAVSEESAPPIVRVTADEIVILQGGAQLALGQVSLDSISYDENDEVVLAGRGNPGRTIIIYVDDAPLMDTMVSESGSWKQALHGLDAGRYVLRVDEIDDDGNVTSRVESPFQREYPEDVREAKATNDTTYTVQPGNSLWVIATGRYGDGMRYHQIFSANKDQIRNPDLIYPGQVFAIPDAQE